MVKGLAFLVLVASSVAAFCLWSMTYTFYFGKLPFDMKPYLEVAGYGNTAKEDKVANDKKALEDEKKSNKEISKTGIDDDASVDTQIVKKVEFTSKRLRNAKNSGGLATVTLLKEKYIVEFYNDLVREKATLTKSQEELADKKRNVEETERSAIELQKKVKSLQDEIKKTLVFIGDEEIKNVKQIVTLISALEVPEAKDLLFKYDDDMMARILRFMAPKKSSAIIGFIMKSKKEEDVNRIKLISDKMRKLTEEKL